MKRSIGIAIVLIAMGAAMIPLLREQDSEVLVETEAGAGTKLPNNWPIDVPVYPRSTVQFSDLREEGKAMTVILQTQAVMVAVMEYYDAELPRSGWTVRSALTGEGGNILLCEKGRRTLSVTAAGEDGAVTVSLAVSEG